MTIYHFLVEFISCIKAHFFERGVCMQTDTSKKLLHSFEKNTNEVFQIHLSSYNNRQYIDLRLWFYRPETRELCPTKKGVMIPLDRLNDLVGGISKIQTYFKDQKTEVSNWRNALWIMPLQIIAWKLKCAPKVIIRRF